MLPLWRFLYFLLFMWSKIWALGHAQIHLRDTELITELLTIRKLLRLLMEQEKKHGSLIRLLIITMKIQEMYSLIITTMNRFWKLKSHLASFLWSLFHLQENWPHYFKILVPSLTAWVLNRECLSIHTRKEERSIHLW